MKKILLINVLIIVLFFFMVELFFSIKNEFSTPIDYQLFDVNKNSLYRPLYGKNFQKRPVIIFGCSIAYGYNLTNDANFGSILSDYTKRPVYNAANVGFGPAHMLKLLKENKILFQVNNPEYIVYTFIDDHKKRLFFHQGWKHDSQLYLRYTLDKNGELQQVTRKYPFYWHFQTVKHIQYGLQRLNYNNNEKVEALMSKIFEDSVSIMKTRYPDAKLILLLYNQDICYDNPNKAPFKTEKILTQEEQNMFKKLGFEIYNMEELVDKSLCGVDYHSYIINSDMIDPYHPSSKMWEEFVPKLVEKLNM